MINVNNSAGINPALLDPLAGAEAAKATAPGYTALDPAQFIGKGARPTSWPRWVCHRRRAAPLPAPPTR